MAEKISGITIKIDGDVSDFQKSLNNINKETRSLDKELKQLKYTAKFNPKNAQLMANQIEVVKQQIVKTDDKLKQLREQEQKLIEQGRNREDDEIWRKLQTEIVATESKLKNYKNNLSELTKEQGGFVKSVNKMGEKLEKTGEKMKSGGKTLTKAVTAPILGIGAASTAAWHEHDEAIDNIIKATGASGDAVKGFEQVYKDVYRSLPVESEAVSGAIGELNTQFGFQGEALKDATEQMVKFGEITGSDVVASTQGAKSAIELYGLESSDLGSVLDRVAKISQDTGVSTDKIFEAAKRGAPQIKAMGLSFDEGATLIGKFEKAGIDSNKALKIMGKAQIDMAKDGISLKDGLMSLSEELKNAEGNIDKATIASKYFKGNGAAFMIEALDSGALSFDDLAEAAGDATGTVSSTFEETQDPIDKTKVIMNNLKETGSELAGTAMETLAPAFEFVTEKVQKFSEWFSSLDESDKKTVVIVAGIAAAIGPLILILGTVAQKGGAIMKTFQGFSGISGFITGPIGIAVAVIGTLVAAFILAYKNSEEFRNKVHELIEKFKEFGAFLKEIITEKVLPALEEFAKVALDVFVNKVIPTIKDFVKILQKGWDNILKPLIDLIVGFVKDNFDKIKGIFEGFIKIFMGIFKTFSSLFKGDWKGFWQGIKKIFEGAWEMISNAAKIAFDAIVRIIKRIWEPIGNFFRDLWRGVLDTIKRVADRIKDALVGTFERTRDRVHGIFDKVGEAITRPIERAKETLSRLVDRIKGLFDFHVRLPHIPMPHFSVSGSMNPFSDGFPPRVSLDWYAQGGIFNAPKVIGVGENGPEAVLPTHKLDKFLEDAVIRVSERVNAPKGGDFTVNFNGMVVREDADIQKIRKEIEKFYKREMRGGAY